MNMLCKVCSGNMRGASLENPPGKRPCLPAAGMLLENRQDRPGLTSGRTTTHYLPAEPEDLIEVANRVGTEKSPDDRVAPHVAVRCNLIIFQDLCPVFDHKPCDVDINDLATFMADLPIVRPLRQGATVDCQNLYFIRIIHRFKCRSVMSLLPSRLSIAFSLLAELLPVWICGRWLAAVLAVEGDAVE